MNNKRIITGSLAALATLPLCWSTVAVATVPEYLEANLISVCRHAAQNNKLAMHRSVKQVVAGSTQVGPTYKVLGAGLRCNDMSLAQFASYYGAGDTLAVIQRYAVPTRIEIQDLQSGLTDYDQQVPEFIQVTFTH